MGSLFRKPEPAKLHGNGTRSVVPQKGRKYIESLLFYKIGQDNQLAHFEWLEFGHTPR